MSARTRELFGLIPVSLLVAAGFAAVLATRTEDVSDATLTYGAVFLGLCVMAHLFIRARRQHGGEAGGHEQGDGQQPEQLAGARAQRFCACLPFAAAPGCF